MAKEVILPNLGMDMTSEGLSPAAAEESDIANKADITPEVNEKKETIGAELESEPIIKVESQQELDKAGVPVEIGEEPKPPKEHEIKKVRATPAARQLAKEYKMDIQKMIGTGPNGRIQMKDVKKMVVILPGQLNYRSPEPVMIGTTLEEILGNPENVYSEPAKEEKEDKVVPNTELDFVPFVEGEVQPLREEIIVKVSSIDSLIDPPGITEMKAENTTFTGKRKVIAERMVKSNLETAVITLTTEIDMTEVKELRKKISKKIEEQVKFRCIYTDFLLMATARALMKHPVINSSLENNEIISHSFVNLGIAVGMDDGLIVPVIRNAHRMSLVEMVKNRADALKSVKNNHYTQEDLKGSTFTITNLGMYGILEFTAIINQPNTAILSVGEVVQRMRVHQGEPVVRSVMKISLNLDHRVAHGMAGAKFLQDVKADMENPSLLLF